MNLRFSFYKLVLVLALLPLVGQAKTVDFLGVTNDGQRGRIKAKLNLPEGRTLKGVTTYSYSMKDGYTIPYTDYTIVEDGGVTYLSADVFYFPDSESYSYRVELTFDDDEKYLSEVVNEDLTEAFIWLGDYSWASAVSGWNSTAIDKEVDPSLNILLDNVRYYKGVSNHAPGYLIYKFEDTSFKKFVTRFGVQDTQADGDVKFGFYTSQDASKTDLNNMEKKVEKVMYSLKNTSRNDAPCVEDLTLDLQDVKAMRIQMDQYDDNNWGDHGNLVMARLYIDAPASENKETQNVTFTTESGDLTENGIALNATAPGGKVYYDIISGRELATIENGVLRPVWGAKGVVIVEATQYGNDKYYPATAYLSFNVDQSPRIEILDFHISETEAGTTGYAYLLVDSKGKALDKLSAQIYSDPRKLMLITTLNLLKDFELSKGAQVIEIPIENFEDQVVRLTYSFDGVDSEQTLPYRHKEGSYDYASDKPFTARMGYGSFPGADKTYNGMNNNVLAIGSADNTYAKGFGIHADGAIEIAPEVLAPYDRLAVDVGGQYPPRSNSEKLAFELMNGNTLLATTEGDVTKLVLTKWDVSINNQQKIQILGHPGSDGNGGDYICYGAPRLYYTKSVKTPQAITWDSEKQIVNNKQTSITLDAKSESGFPIFYYMVKGAQYATLNDNILTINNLPGGGAEVVIEAVQPGNNTWGMAPKATCTFRLVHGLEVQKYEYVELTQNDVLDELIIHADKSSAGQVALKGALVDVKTLILKYTFNPGEWVHIAFPSDLDIDKVSNLGALGYTYNAFGAPAYYIKEYDTEMHAIHPTDDPWKTLDRPSVKGKKGYIMSLDPSPTEEPVEVTFTISNSNVDLANLMRTFGLSLDLTNTVPGTKQKITVSSADPDIQSNSLTIDVEFNPSDLSTLPVNHEYALENMRFIFINGHKAIRLTLPDPSPARIVFFDNSGKKVVKAVNYIAPNVIDLQDLKSGQYFMVVNYGPATKTYPIEIHD